VAAALPSSQPLGTATINGSAEYTSAGGPVSRATTLKLSGTANITGQSVQAPYSTFSNSGPPSSVFAESHSGTEFAISDAGTGMYDNVDQYSAIYQASSVGTQATIQTEVVTPDELSGYGKAGIIVRNDMTGSGTTPEGVILYASPSGGIQLEWDDNGGDYIDNATPSNGTIANTVPVELQLVRNGDTYTGYYAVPGGAWQEVGSVTVPDQASTQDAGMFVSANSADGGEVPSTAVFDGFSVTS
jgi:alpha-galactosidase